MIEMMNDDILTLADVAEYLKISEKTLLKMVRNSAIPCARIGNQWRFSRMMINDWLSAQMKVLPRNDLSRFIESGNEIWPLSRLVSDNGVVPALTGRTRDPVIRELGLAAAEAGLVTDPERFIGGLIEREDMASTAIGKRIALPHLRTPNSHIVHGPAVLIGVSAEGVKFGAEDGSLTTLFFLIVSDSECVHLKIMAKLASILKRDEVCTQLHRCVNARDFIRFFLEHERRSLIA